MHAKDVVEAPSRRFQRLTLAVAMPAMQAHELFETSSKR
jgi:hypothetical protein